MVTKLYERASRQWRSIISSLPKDNSRPYSTASPDAMALLRSYDPSHIDRDHCFDGNVQKLGADLAKKGTTMTLLWQESLQAHSSSYRYSRFVEMFREWEGRSRCTMLRHHRPREKLFVDFSGIIQILIVVERNLERFHRNAHCSMHSASCVLIAARSETIPPSS